MSFMNLIQASKNSNHQLGIPLQKINFPLWTSDTKYHQVNINDSFFINTQFQQ